MRKDVVYWGAGYVGLTGAVHFGRAGVPVTIYDIDPGVVTSINQGQPRGQEFLSYLHTDLARLLHQQRLRATTNILELAQSTTFLVAVPSEKQGQPWMDAVIESVLNIIRVCENLPLIIIESTLTPGTAGKIVQIVGERMHEVCGEDYYLAVAPRKDWFADQNKSLATLPRIVGGVTPECTRQAVEVLQQVSSDIHKTDAETAELTKAIENGLFHTCVMYAQELAMALPEKNIAEALRLACLHWRLPTVTLGFGTGGRCIPLGNKYLLAAAKGATPGQQIEERLPLACHALALDQESRNCVADFAEDFCSDAYKRVLVLGLGYRPDFSDVGQSPGLAIAQRLARRGVPVVVHDTLYTAAEVKKKFELDYLPLAEMASCDLILLATPHSSYLPLPHSQSLWREGQVVLDAQGAWAGCRELFLQHGVHYTRVGDPRWLSLPFRTLMEAR